MRETYDITLTDHNRDELSSEQALALLASKYDVVMADVTRYAAAVNGTPIGDLTVEQEFEYIRAKYHVSVVDANWFGSKPIPIIGLTLAVSNPKYGPAFSMYEKSVKVGVTYDPTNTTQKKLTWESNDTSVATVSQTGVVTFVGWGTADITATSTIDQSPNPPISDTVSITVEKVALTGVSLSTLPGTLAVNKKIKLSDYTVLDPIYADVIDVTYTSSDPSVAKVENGYLVGVSEGIGVTVTVKANTGTGEKTGSKTIDVVQIRPLTKVTIAFEDPAPYYVNTKNKLELTYVPVDANDVESVLWTSSAPTIASVDATGEVTFLQASTSKVTFTANVVASGKTKTATLSINAIEEEPLYAYWCIDPNFGLGVTQDRDPDYINVEDITTYAASNKIILTGEDQVVPLTYVVSSIGRLYFLYPDSMTLTMKNGLGQTVSNQNATSGPHPAVQYEGKTYGVWLNSAAGPGTLNYFANLTV